MHPKTDLVARLEKICTANRDLPSFFQLFAEVKDEYLPCDQFFLFLFDGDARRVFLPEDVATSFFQMPSVPVFSFEDTPLSTIFNDPKILLREFDAGDTVLTAAERTLWDPRATLDMSVPVFTAKGDVIGVFTCIRNTSIGFSNLQKKVAVEFAESAGRILEYERTLHENEVLKKEKAQWRESYFALVKNCESPACLVENKRVIAKNMLWQGTYKSNSALPGALQDYVADLEPSSFNGTGVQIKIEGETRRCINNSK